MLSLDANLLLYCYSKGAPQHAVAHRFITSLADRDAVALSDFVLTEFHLLLRDPAALAKPLTASQVVAVVQNCRRHPRWRVLGVPPDNSALHARLREVAAQPGIARRRIHDTRAALTFGFTRLATADVKDFAAFGFAKVWNPLAA